MCLFFPLSILFFFLVLILFFSSLTCCCFFCELTIPLHSLWDTLAMCPPCPRVHFHWTREKRFSSNRNVREKERKKKKKNRSYTNNIDDERLWLVLATFLDKPNNNQYRPKNKDKIQHFFVFIWRPHLAGIRTLGRKFPAHIPHIRVLLLLAIRI